MSRVYWRMAPATDEGKFPRGWHLFSTDEEGKKLLIGSVCGEYVPAESSRGEDFVSWRWRIPGGKTSAVQYAEESDAKAALEQYLRRLAAGTAKA